MITDQLNALVKEFETKKDILDNHTSDIVSEIKSWCVKENNRLANERKNILDFFKANVNLVKQYMAYSSWTSGNFMWSWGNLSICGRTNDFNGRSVNFGAVTLNKNVGKRPFSCLTANWSELANDTHTDIDFWVSVKNFLLNENDNLNEIVSETKKFLSSLINEQNNRFHKISEAVEDIKKENIIELKVTIRC